MEFFVLTIPELARHLKPSLADIDIGFYVPRKRRRVPILPLATLVATLVWFSSSSLGCWKKFVFRVLPMHFIGKSLSYSRWCFWRKELSGLVEALAATLCLKIGYRGVSLVDSTCLPVCGIQRERDHKCFVGSASKGCSSLGWFFGFKLHVIASDTGEILRFWLSTGKTHDTAPLFQPTFLQGLRGTLVGDSGYRVQKNKVTALEPGLTLLARPVGINDTALPWALRKLFKARWRIETLFGELKDGFGLRESRHCKCLDTFKTSVFSSLIAYTLSRRFAPA
jgi:hypothetical protein